MTGGEERGDDPNLRALGLDELRRQGYNCGVASVASLDLGLLSSVFVRSAACWWKEVMPRTNARSASLNRGAASEELAVAAGEVGTGSRGR